MKEERNYISPVINEGSYWEVKKTKKKWAWLWPYPESDQKWLIHWWLKKKRIEDKVYYVLRLFGFWIDLFPDGHSRWAICILYILPQNIGKICIVPDFLFEVKKQKENDLENGIITAFFSLSLTGAEGVLLTEKCPKKTGNQRHDFKAKCRSMGFFFPSLCYTRY